MSTPFKIQTTMATPLFIFIFTFIITITLLLPISTSQTTVAPPPSSTTCNDIYISYTVSSVQKIPPTQKANQPYRFESSLYILNNGLDELKSWRVFVGFKNDEVLVSATNAVLSDGTRLPGKVGNGSVFVGYPNADLKTGIETAGDVNQMSVTVDLVGTEFGVGVGSFPLPHNVSLVNDGFLCPQPTIQGIFWFDLCFDLCF